LFEHWIQIYISTVYFYIIGYKLQDIQVYSYKALKKKFFVGTHINALTYTCPVSDCFLFVFLWYNSP